jgi:hypothetical protein
MTLMTAFRHRFGNKINAFRWVYLCLWGGREGRGGEGRGGEGRG